jgi:hypothetical protein
MVNSAVGAITSLRLVQADFSAKRAACVRKPAGKASFLYSAALSAEVSSAVTFPCVLVTRAKAVGIS